VGPTLAALEIELSARALADHAPHQDLVAVSLTA